MGEPLKGNLPCTACGSSDAVTLYKFREKEKYYTRCYSCGRVNADVSAEEPIEVRSANKEVYVNIQQKGKTAAIPERDITKETAAHYGVTVDGNKIYFPYGDTGIKGRTLEPKSFWVEGKIESLFGQERFATGGRYVTIVEGEFDALAAFQMFGNRYPCVSVPNGADGAVKAVQRAYEWLDSFENVIIAFDADPPGQKAAAKVAELFPGKAKILKHKQGFKDANEYLMQDNSKGFVDAWWGAEKAVLDGIVQASTLWDAVNAPVEQSAVFYPFVDLNKLTYGIRMGELVMVTAGSGLGKTQFLREIVWHILNKTEDNIGLMFLEESVQRTAKSIMSLAANKPLHLPGNIVTDEEMKDAFNATLGTNRLYLFDHFGSTSIDNIVSRVRYMAKALNCRYIFLDHVSIVVSAGSSGDERKALDEIMTRLRMLVQETGIALICVSHLRRPEGKGHEEGASTSLGQLRGSGGIGQLSDIVIGLERNGQAEDEEVRHTTRIRVLKNRFSGLTGPAGYARYYHDTGRMLEVDYEQEDEEL